MERAIVFAALALPLLAFPVHAQSIRIGAIAEITREREPRRPLEPHLAVHPGNPDHLLAAAMIGSLVGTLEEQQAAQRCATFLSLDGGETWSRHDFPLIECCDPGVAFTSDGAAVFVALARNPPQPGNEWIVVHHSTDGGRTWAAVPALMGPNPFRQLPTNGDYFGLVSTAPGRFRLVWPETRDDVTPLLTVSVDVEGKVGATPIAVR